MTKDKNTDREAEKKGKPRLVKHAECGYEWQTGSRKAWVTCPNCLKKFKVDEGIKEAKK